MPSFTMTLWREIFDQDACIEYALIPEGKRRVLQLRPHQQADARTDVVDVDITRVNVFSLQNNQRVHIKDWQFPDQGLEPIDGTLVQVFEQLGHATATVMYRS